MRAAVFDRYGPPDVVSLREVPDPQPKAGEVLVRVRAAGLNTGDWRLRAAAFPGVMALPGRLMFGVTGPRQGVLGSEFAGEVAAHGPGAQESADLAIGTRVFGFSSGRAHAELLAMPAEGCIAPIPSSSERPEGLSFEEAAALPFGAIAALVFLRDYAKLRQGERVMIVGATGGVGVYAVQIAATMGAHVTGSASAGSLDLVRSLGAARAVDYRTEGSIADGEPFDVIFDPVGATCFADARPRLNEGGRYIPLNFGLRKIVQSLRTRNAHRRVLIGVNGDTRDDLNAVARMVEEGSLRPVIDRSFPFDAIRDAHAHVEARRRKGAVVLTEIGSAVAAEPEQHGIAAE